MELLQRATPAFLIQASDKYPLTAQALQAFARYATGSGDRETALRGLKESFFDLETFAQWYEKQWEKTSPTSSWLRKSGSDLRNSLTAAAESVCQARTSAGGQGAKFEEFRRRLFQDLLRSMPINVVRRLSETLHLQHCPDELTFPWESMPSLQTAITVMAQVGKHTAMLPGKGRVARLSDYGDILHTFNLPFVDIFRADGFIAAAISDAKLPFKTVVVGKFRDLLTAIERQLRTAND